MRSSGACTVSNSCGTLIRFAFSFARIATRDSPSSGHDHRSQATLTDELRFALHFELRHAKSRFTTEMRDSANRALRRQQSVLAPEANDSAESRRRHRLAGQRAGQHHSVATTAPTWGAYDRYRPPSSQSRLPAKLLFLVADFNNLSRSRVRPLILASTSRYRRSLLERIAPHSRPTVPGSTRPRWEGNRPRTSHAALTGQGPGGR